MAKLPHQSSVPPVDPQDSATKDYADSAGGADADAIHDNVAGEINAIATKTGPVGTDVVVLEDSEAAFVKKSTTLAAITDGVSGVVPIADQAMDFDGTNYARITDVASGGAFDLPDDFTLEAWVKADSDHDFTICDKASGSWGNFTLFHNAGANLWYLWYLVGGGNQVDTVSFDLPGLGLINKWLHIAVTRNRTAGIVKFYLNGVQLGSDIASSTGAADTDAGDFRVGRDAGGTRDLDGSLSDVRVWSTARTAAQIFQNYRSGLKGDESGLVAYYRGDDFNDSGPSGLDLDLISAPVNIASQAGSVVAHGLETATGSVSIDKATAPTVGQVLTGDGSGNATWETPAGGGAADALSTSGADVDVSAASPPSVGQGLVATGATTATWQDIVAGGGGTPPPASAYAAEFGVGGNNSKYTSNALLDVPTDVTCECWFNGQTLDTTWNALFGKGRTVSLNNNYALIVRDGEFKWQARGAADETLDVTESVSNAVGEWHHYAATRDDTTGNTKLYFDGVQVGSTTSPSPGSGLDQSSNELRLGAEANQSTPIEEGRIYDARIWNVVRTPDEIFLNYKATLAGDETGLVANYTFADNDWTDSGPNGINLGSTTGSPTLEVDQPFSDRSADALDGVGGVVPFEGPASPTTGHVLTKTATGMDFQAAAGGGAADALSTSGADVVVSAASPPTVGQALVADSPTLASWQDVAAASAPIAAAQGDYLMAVMALEHSAVVGQPVEYEVAKSQRGELQIDAVNHKITGLKAGRTYHIQAHARSRNDWFAAEIYDITAAEVVGIRALPVHTDGSFSSTSSVPVTSYTYTPTVDTEIEFRVTAINSAGALVNADGSWISVVEIGAVQADVVGGLEFMDIIEVGAATNSVAFGASGDGDLLRALDGDIDEDYIVVARIVNVNQPSTGAFELRPNGATADREAQKVTMSGTSVVASDEAGVMRIAEFGFKEIQTTIELSAKSGRVRAYSAIGTALQFPTEDAAIHNYAGIWGDTAANITSLEVFSSSGNHIGEGSEFKLFRRTRNNLRADSAAVYERMAMETVDPGALATTERTVGHTIFGGSVVGVSARVEDAVTAGSITVNIKVDGTTTLTAVLDTTNSTSHVVREAIGVHRFAANKNVSVEFVPTSYDNAGSIASAVTVQVHLTNDALIAPPKDTQIESNLWHPPEVGHDLDLEFDSEAVPAGWAWTVAPDASVIDPYAGFTGTGPRVAYSTLRPSWLMVQPPADGAHKYLHKAHTIPTDFFMWARMSFGARGFTSPVNNDFSCGIRMSVTDTGAPSSVNYAGILINEADTGITGVNAFGVEASSFEFNVSSEDRYGAQMTAQPLEYIAIQKIGNEYHYWMAPAQGSWIHLGVWTTYGGAAFDRIAIHFANVSQVSPGNMIMGADFFRFKDSALYLP